LRKADDSPSFHDEVEPEIGGDLMQEIERYEKILKKDEY
jgi:hypothetical protein